MWKRNRIDVASSKINILINYQFSNGAGTYRIRQATDNIMSKKNVP